MLTQTISYGATQVLGKYGQMHVGSSRNTPGSRIGGATWEDPTSGLLYLFGGHCIDSMASISMCGADVPTFSPLCE